MVRKMWMASLVLVLLFVMVGVVGAQDVPPLDTSNWPTLDEFLGGQLAEFLRTLDPIRNAPVTIAAIALIKWVVSKLGYNEQISATAISTVVIGVVFAVYVIAQMAGYGGVFADGAALAAVALDGALKVLILLFGQQVLYLGARRLNVPVFGYSRTLPPSAKQAA